MVMVDGQDCSMFFCMASGYGKTETKTMAGQTHWLNNILFGIEGKKIKNKIDQTGLVGSDVVLCMVIIINHHRY